jgi:phosphoenolpyruvate carboxylase
VGADSNALICLARNRCWFEFWGKLIRYVLANLVPSSFIHFDVFVIQSDEDKRVLREMYQEWPWFREIVSLISMLISKTDFSITKNYDELLVEPKLMSLGDEIRDKLVETRQAVIDVSGTKEISGPHVQLMRASSKIRNPYVDSINVVQAEILKMLRSMPDDDSPDLTPEMKNIKDIRTDALLLSIKGIAQGMKNSG